ncbi:lysine exporter protein LysE/YggA, partial [mine drainage metagenome]
KAATSIWKAFSIGLGAMTADLTLMLLIFLLRSEVNFLYYEKYLFLVGAIFLFYIAYEMYSKRNTSSMETAGSYLRGLTVGLVNPMQIGWWLSVGLSFLTAFGYIVFYFLFLGIVIWVLALSVLIKVGVRAYGERAQLATRIVSIVLLVSFGLYFLVNAIAGLA